MPLEPREKPWKAIHNHLKQSLQPELHQSIGSDYAFRRDDPFPHQIQISGLPFLLQMDLANSDALTRHATGNAKRAQENETVFMGFRDADDAKVLLRAPGGFKHLKEKAKAYYRSIGK